MSLEQHIQVLVRDAVKALYGVDAEDSQIQLQKTRPEFEGNILQCVIFFRIFLSGKGQVQRGTGLPQSCYRRCLLGKTT